MKYGSLFSGIGGIDLGLDRSGMTCAWQVEQNEFCRKVLEKHWPNVPRLTDVRDVDRNTVEPVDLICGGFPCQDVSLAGKRKGLDGGRSGLWFEFLRIIRSLRPRYVLVENVPGLFTSNGGRDFGTILGGLAESGYDAEWRVISARDVGAGHLRKRVWVVAYPKSISDKRQSESNSNSRMGSACSDNRLPGGASNQDVAYSKSQQNRRKILSRLPTNIGASDKSRITSSDSYNSGLEKREVVPSDLREKLQAAERSNRKRGYWATEPNVGRVADGVPSRVDRLKALGNAVVPQVAEFIGRLIAEHDERM